MKKTGIIAAAGLAALISSCSSSAPKADMKTDVDSLSYSIGMAQTQGLKPYLVNRLGVDTTYLAEFVKGLNEGANAGDDKKKTAYYAKTRPMPWLPPYLVSWRMKNFGSALARAVVKTQNPLLLISSGISGSPYCSLSP